MATVRVMSLLNMTSGIPEDRPVNTFHMQTPVTPVWEGAGGFVEHVQAFYDSFSTYLPGTVASSGHIIKVYDLADPEPRAPIYEGTWTMLSTPSGNPLPSEVSLCVSYECEQISGTPQARRRGRIFLGPLDVSALGTDGRPVSGLIDDAGQGWSDFIETLEADLTMFVGIYSRVSSTLNQPIENVWVDNAFDTQRRRGLATTARSNFNVVH